MPCTNPAGPSICLGYLRIFASHRRFKVFGVAKCHERNFS